MEQTMKNRIIITVLAFLGMSPLCYAQAPMIPVHDPQLYKQIDVMESGGWDFAPDWYYYSLHKKYSGASWNTKWTPFPKFSISFNEAKSDVKRCITPRTASMLREKDVLKKTTEELDSITPIMIEEMTRSLDRQVDLAYNTVKSEFNDLQAQISENLQFVLQRSKGKMDKVVARYVDANDLLCSRIEYIHRSGPEYELENTKREIAYEEARQDMKKLAKETYRLVFYTAANYDKE